MKACTKCGIEKELSEFVKNKAAKTGYGYHCLECHRSYGKTKKGLISNIYKNQIQRSKTRGHQPPDYTRNELYKWLVSNKEFLILYDEWKCSGYDSNIAPGCDRIDDYKGYCFSNITVTTFNKNRSRSHSDRKNGINNKGSCRVTATDVKTNKTLTFYSMRQAERETGIKHQNISASCLDNIKAGGYRWRKTLE